MFFFIAAFVNAGSLFQRTRVYKMYHAHEPLSSPNAKFVEREATPVPQYELDDAGLVRRAMQHVWGALTHSVRFLLGRTPEQPQVQTVGRVQILAKWDPAEFEMILFAIYSPIHPLLWLALTSANWILMSMIMVFTGLQVCVVVAYDVRV